MPPHALPPNELPAYYHAAQAVLAVEFGIEVRHVTIEPDALGRTYTRLARLNESCNLRSPYALATIDQIEKYAIALLAGIVGRQLRIESHFGYNKRCVGQVRLKRKFLARVRKSEDPDVDRAFAITFAWLASKDDGNAAATTERLWRRARRLMRDEPHRTRCSLLADQLKTTGRMCGREISNLFGG